jgi:hypothetical protein
MNTPDHDCGPERLNQGKWILRLEPDPGDRTRSYAHTIGLTWYGLPELVIYEVPAFARGGALVLVRNLAQCGLDTGALIPGTTYLVGLDALQVTVKTDGEDPQRPLHECRRAIRGPYAVLAIEPA